MITIGDIEISNRWVMETNPATWTKSSILDNLKIRVNLTTAVGILTSGEVFVLPAMFREVGTLYSGLQRPSKGFYLDTTGKGVGVHAMVETGIQPLASNHSQADFEIISSTEFWVEFEFRMLADTNDFVSDVTMSNIDKMLNNSINATTALENIVASVYNKVKELQLYVYIKDDADDVFTTLVRQQVQAKFYGGHTEFSWDGSNDYCALNGSNDFAFIYNPVQAVDANYQKMLFDAISQDTTDYVDDLNFVDLLDAGNTNAGDTYSFNFSDYDAQYYTAIVYNLAGVSYSQIEEKLVSTCLPEQCPVVVYGHIADYMGGVSAPFTSPCSNILTIQKNIDGNWWTPIQNLTCEVGFDGGVAPSYPTMVPAYVGVFPIDGEVVETNLGAYVQGWTAKAVPVGVNEFQHNANAATMATNFKNHINANFAAEWTATIGADPRQVTMLRVFPNGYSGNDIFLGYKQTGGSPIVTADLVAWGTDLSSFVIFDNSIPNTTTILFGDSPAINSKADLINYINNNTIYTATDEGAVPDDIKVCMPRGIYTVGEMSTSNIQLNTKLGEPLNIKQFTGGGSGAIEDNTIQAVSERLIARAIWDKQTYDDCASGDVYFNDTDTDLTSIRILIGGNTYTAIKQGTNWTTNNSRLSIIDTGVEVTAEFAFRGLFDNDQSIPDWAATVQAIQWQFISTFSTPTNYERVVQYNQQIDFKRFDDNTVPLNEVIQFVSLFKADGVTPINNLCNESIVRVIVQAHGATVGSYKIVACISPEPYGVTLESEQGMEEDNSWVGNLPFLTSEKLTVVDEDLTSISTAEFQIDVSKLNLGVRYRVYAIAYKQ